MKLRKMVRIRLRTGKMGLKIRDGIMKKVRRIEK
jgi:hypothetical protein